MCVVLLLFAGVARSWADDSLARYVPAEVGFFVEARDAADLLTPLTEAQIWTTLAEMAGQPARPEDADIWRRTIKQTVQMEPAEAIRTLFARRVAFVGQGPGRAQDAVVYCRPAASIDDLLKKWPAKLLPEPQTPATYHLYSNIGVIRHDDLLVFGDVLPDTGMFKRVQSFLATTKRALADDALYRKLLERVPANPDGVLFARLKRTAAPASRPASPAAGKPRLSAAPPDLPGPLRGAENILLALHRDSSLLRFTAVGDRAAAKAALKMTPAAGARLLPALPERTLLAWEGRLDYPGLLESINDMPAGSGWRVAVSLPPMVDGLPRLSELLGSSTVLAVGLVSPANRSPGLPPVPAGAYVVEARQPQEVEREFGALVDSCAGWANLGRIRRNRPTVGDITTEPMAGGTLHKLDLSPFVQKGDAGLLGELHLCWTVQDGLLIVASHSDWLRQIVAARHGGRTLEAALKLAGREIPAASENALVVQAGPISDVGQLWLNELQKRAPEVLGEEWWRKRQPGGSERLGIDVDPTGDPHRLQVKRVQAGQPAEGFLEAGDELLGCNSQRFATTQPWLEMREQIDNRPHGAYLDVLMQRGVADPRVVRIPMPFVNLAQTLERIVAIGRVAQRVVYFDDAPDAAGPRGFLTIELRRSSTPLFDFSMPGSPSQPASRPVLIGGDTGAKGS